MSSLLRSYLPLPSIPHAHDSTSCDLSTSLSIMSSMAPFEFRHQTGDRTRTVILKTSLYFSMDSKQHSLTGSLQYFNNIFLPNLICSSYCISCSKAEGSSLTSSMAGSGVPLSVKVLKLDLGLPEECTDTEEIDRSLCCVPGLLPIGICFEG